MSTAAQILQRVPNNYETDLIFPIVAAAARLAGLDYAAASPKQRAALKVSPPSPSSAMPAGLCRRCEARFQWTF